MKWGSTLGQGQQEVAGFSRSSGWDMGCDQPKEEYVL